MASRFRDAADFYAVMDALFQGIAERADVTARLLAAKMVLRFRYVDPVGQITFDLRGAEIRWSFGESDVKPDLEMILSTETAHHFWLGRLSIPAALATRKIVSRGPVTKALALLPALKPVYPLYGEVLRGLGRADWVDEHPRRFGRGDAEPRVWKRIKAWMRGRGVRHGDRLVSWPPGPRLEVGPSDAGPALKPTSVPPDDVELLRRMMEIRAFELALSDAYAKGEVPTEAIHLSIGQEAVAVGVCSELRPGDHIATTHRGHGHMLAKGADLEAMMAEIFGKAAGSCGGKGGSMHVTDATVGAMGANGIVGASCLIAAGSAHAARLQGIDRVAVAFLGDGATNQGMFHEGVNFAAVLDLPAVFVVENNLYGEFTPLARHVRVERLATRAAAYGIPGVTVDGNDIRAVREATRSAVERAKSGGGPTLIECRTYRWHGHMEGEQHPYRSSEEIERWKALCPIAAFRSVLVAEGGLDERRFAAMQAEVDARVQAALAAARSAPEPAPHDLMTQVFSPEPAEVLQADEPCPGPRELTYSAALFEALEEEMLRDPSVYLLGEDVATGGYFAVTAGLADRVGAGRVIDTPISEYAILGSAVGAAMAGARPVVEILFSDFLASCMDPLVNQAAKLRYMSGGQYRLPLVIRTPGGAGLGMAAQHSQSLEALFTGVPGLIVVAPATPLDAKGLLKAAIRSNNPVLFFENKVLYAETGPVAEGDALVPLGRASVKRTGRDATMVSIGGVLGRVMEAASVLSAEGVDVEVVDLRTLAPLDLDTILRSVRKTGRLVTVEDGPLFHGFGAEVVARVARAAFGALVSAPERVAGLDVPIPYNNRLENLALPDAPRIAAAIRAVMG